MNIAQALKQKNRNVGEMNKVFAQIVRHNVVSGRVGTADVYTHKVDVAALFATYQELFRKLCDTKAAIQKASVTVSAWLVELSETKSLLAKIQEIPTKEGKETISGYNTAPYEMVYIPIITEEQISKTTEDLQNHINTLQDDIDAYNSLTKVPL